MVGWLSAITVQLADDLRLCISTQVAEVFCWCPLVGKAKERCSVCKLSSYLLWSLWDCCPPDVVYLSLCPVSGGPARDKPTRLQIRWREDSNTWEWCLPRSVLHVGWVSKWETAASERVEVRNTPAYNQCRICPLLRLNLLFWAIVFSFCLGGLQFHLWLISYKGRIRPFGPSSPLRHSIKDDAINNAEDID